MEIIDVKFFGTPSVSINKKLIKLPYVKAEGVFYLLLYEKIVSREFLSSLLWGDMEDKYAKKNLRNAIYIIRKHTLDDIIVSPKRSLLQLNEKYSIKSEIDYINEFDPSKPMDLNDIEEFLNCYNGRFLEDIKMRSNQEFADWIDSVAVKLHSTYINKLKILSKELIELREYNYSEICSIKLIELEEYEEEGYINLMKINKYRNKYQDAIHIYNILSEKLNNELSIRPSKETEEAYKDIVKNIKINIESKKPEFWGRKIERENIYNNIYSFVAGKPFNSIIIYGEEGIGKSLLLNEIVNDFNFDVLLIKIDCHEYESDFIFKFWDKVFEQISDVIKERNLKVPWELMNNIAKSFPTLEMEQDEKVRFHSFNYNYQLTEKAIFDLFTLLSNKLNILFVIDDLNNVDNGSLELLYKTILANRNKIMLIATDDSSNNYINDKLYNLLKYNNIVERIFLNRFSYEETKIFIEQNMPEAKDQVQKIFNESEGNPLFIAELINSIKNSKINGYMTIKIESLINKRLNDISEGAMKLLNICSLFQDKFYLEVLSSIMEMNTMELIDIIDELLSKNILVEERKEDNRLGLYFTHRKISEYIYNNMSISKRTILHSKIAEYYEIEFLNHKNRRRILYPELIYHLTQSYSNCKLFKYKTRWLEEILNINHEIFPIVESSISEGLGLIEYYLEEDFLEKELKGLNELYETALCKNCDECVEEKIIYLYIYGRFNKNKGDFQKGLKYLQEMIDISEQNNYTEYTYKGYLQLSHCYLNIYDLKNMEDAITKAEEVTNILNDRCKEAVVWRLKGYLYILLGKFEEGEKYIKNALERFNSSENKNKYLLNIVASLFYLGESYRIKENFEKALEYYNEAIDLQIDNEEYPAAAIVLSKIGFIKYKQNKIDEAQYYYLKSLKGYEKNIFAWGRAEVYYYLFKIYKEKDKIEIANHYLEKSLNFVDKYSSEETRNNIYKMIEK